MSGWIKLHRASKGEPPVPFHETAVWKSPQLWQVWCWCLLKASHSKQTFPLVTGRGVTLVTVGPGQFVYGRAKAAKELGQPGTTIEGRMKKLVELQNLVMQPVKHYTIVTICNWSLYQDDEAATCQQIRQATVKQPSSNRQATVTYKNVKNEEECKDNNTDAAVDALFDAWNQLPNPIRMCQHISAARRHEAEARLADDWWAANWQSGMARVAASSFCRGGGQQKWLANIDWFLEPNTLAKIMEGQYDDQPQNLNPPAPLKLANQSLAEMRKIIEEKERAAQ